MQEGIRDSKPVGRVALPPPTGSDDNTAGTEEPGSNYRVIARSTATWQSVSVAPFGSGKAAHCRGCGLPRPSGSQ